MVFLALTAPVGFSNDCLKQTLSMLARLLIPFQKIVPALSPLLGIFCVE
jgi:hypothetical protein